MKERPKVPSFFPTRGPWATTKDPKADKKIAEKPTPEKIGDQAPAGDKPHRPHPLV